LLPDVAVGYLLFEGCVCDWNFGKAVMSTGGLSFMASLRRGMHIQGAESMRQNAQQLFLTVSAVGLVPTAAYSEASLGSV
jgi:hypothetical protein